MTERELPSLKLSDITLLGLNYRFKEKELELESKDSDGLQGSIKYSYHFVRKNSFRVRTTQQISLKGITFTIKHEVKFISEDPIEKTDLDDKEFQRRMVNKILPFTSELFAYISGKSITIPIISPDRIGKGK